MNKYQNMKIAINEQQPLDEVVEELGRLGYECYLMKWWGYGIILTDDEGGFTDYLEEYDWIGNVPIVTLTQLKAMEN